MAVTDSAPASRRQSLGRWLRVIVSAVLLAVLVAKIHPEDLLPERRHFSTLAFLAAGVVITGLGIVLSAWRWQRVLDVFDVRVPLRTLTKHYFAGQFVGNVLPSTIGGDVVRVSRGATTTGSGSVAFASVVLERLSGFIALPLLVFIGFLLRPSLLDNNHAWIALAIAFGTLVLLALILVVAGHQKLAGRFAEHENWMRFVGAVHVGIDRLRRQPRDAFGVLGAAVVYQLSVVAALYCAVQALDISIPNAAVIAFIPAVAMGQVVPLSVSGFGVREGLLVLLLHPLGVSTSSAVALGLFWYGMLLIVSLLGAPAFAMGQRAVRSAMRSGGDTTNP
ncbi:MAG TPA: lysylphosphatidylglycerol synthase transmembrane domain-containing protein [Acidimicrobiia bacterium]|nr:lysylphosphatidylglycerol synthase transmembrane domain-containing protein [Acidimicrobiia bacterium]